MLLTSILCLIITLSSAIAILMNQKTIKTIRVNQSHNELLVKNLAHKLVEINDKYTHTENMNRLICKRLDTLETTVKQLQADNTILKKRLKLYDSATQGQLVSKSFSAIL